MHVCGVPQSILCNNISYRNIQSSVGIHFGSVLNCQYRSIQTQVNIFQRSTVAALYKKGPGVCRGARPCAPLRFSHIPMWIYPLRASAVHVAYSQGGPQTMQHIRSKFHNLCGIHGRNSAVHAAIRPGPPQPMRLLFPHTKFRKYLINKVFPK